MRVLFVCTGNTCRSPMAERLARHFYPQHEFESAGVMPTGGMHPLTRQVLTEHHADGESFTSRSVYELDLTRFNLIILIGDLARELAPDMPAGVQAANWDVTDPIEARGTPEEKLAAYRTCASELIHRLSDLLGPAKVTQDEVTQR